MCHSSFKHAKNAHEPLRADVCPCRYSLHSCSRRFPLSQNIIRLSQQHFNNSSHPKARCSVPPKRHIETVAADALHGLIPQHRGRINITFPKTSGPLSKTKPQSVQLSLLRLAEGSCTNMDERQFLTDGVAVKSHGEGAARGKMFDGGAAIVTSGPSVDRRRLLGAKRLPENKDEFKPY